eukprot:CAMPEP_0113967080 /NCGR_PEP_ID=MMETSP0011_2-20120614/8714_1 /TAXON_ID=101924 /ORGANISM="Rhodosorus marinus" /LENGTH=265 /DNA_ID=CAMNT_0000979889 /DNA_START=71 /DNA_END=868 /DNA_ORIENTATION=- /assembly_acc=CAM_ASM_000156
MTSFVPSGLPSAREWRRVGLCQVSRASYRRRGGVVARADDGSGPEITAGDALRAWETAQKSGQTPLEDKEVSLPDDKVFRILFVCRDNLTTSVVAEAILKDLIERRQYSKYIEVESAGYQVIPGGNPPEEFVNAMKFRRKLDIGIHQARKLVPTDVDKYQLIICMDTKSRNNVLYMKIGNPGIKMSEEKEKELEMKVKVLSQYCTIDKLRTAQFPSGEYRQAALGVMISSVVDGCNGLISKLSRGVDNVRRSEQNDGSATSQGSS